MNSRPAHRGPTNRALHGALHRALAVSLARSDFRIVHLAVLRNRIELLVEADNKTALARGMQGFQVSAAKWLNRAARRRGPVFPDRYRMRILETRVDVRDLLGRLPRERTDAWPQTRLLQLELLPIAMGQRSTWASWRRGRIRSRADEYS
jgi:hypothetical protein